MTAMGIPQSKDEPLPPTLPKAVNTATAAPPTGAATGGEAGSAVVPPFLYFDISFLLITKLHIICHDLLDTTNLFHSHTTTRSPTDTATGSGMNQIDFYLPDLIFHRNQLSKKKKKGGKIHRKVYSIYELPVVIGKRIGLKLLKWNREAVLKIIGSGVLGPMLKMLKKKKKNRIRLRG
jgi:hypothetical protein